MSTGFTYNVAIETRLRVKSKMADRLFQDRIKTISRPYPDYVNTMFANSIFVKSMFVKSVFVKSMFVKTMI